MKLHTVYSHNICLLEEEYYFQFLWDQKVNTKSLWFFFVEMIIHFDLNT